MDQESPLSDLVSRLALALDYPDGSDASRNLGLAKVTTFQDWMYCFFFFQGKQGRFFIGFKYEDS